MRRPLWVRILIALALSIAGWVAVGSFVWLAWVLWPR